MQLKGRLPNWANEGIAIYCQPDKGAKRVQEARRYHLKKQLQPTQEFMQFMLYPSGSEAVARFYSQAGLTFGVLARRLGPLKALRLTLKINREGPVKALESARLSLPAFESLLKQELLRR